MSVTVVVNYMTVSHKGSSGISIAFPDICKTPILGVPVPIPYPNIAMSSDLKKGSKKVKCDGKKVVLKSSKIKRSMGDEVGVQKGLISNKQMGKAKFANYSFDVKVEGKNVCRLADPTTQNRGTINAMAFCHLQKPDTVKGENAELIKGACEAVESEGKKQDEALDPAKKGSAKSSGIIPRHWDAMQAFLDKSANWMLYFRNTGADCAQWIEAGHEPKPHSVLDGNCLKESKPWLVTDARMWILKHLSSDEVGKAADEGLVDVVSEEGRLRSFDISKLYGIVVRTAENRGKIQPAITQPFMGEKKWMTGDYDLMDVISGKYQCERPIAAMFGLLQLELNSAMKWPGIQHPYQAAWNTRRDEGFTPDADKQVFEFNVLTAISTWLRSVAGATQDDPAAKSAAASKAPKAIFAEGRDPSDLIDDNLTVLAPGGGLQLKDREDYWNALVCSGCLDEDKPEQQREAIETGKAEQDVKRDKGKELDYQASIDGVFQAQGRGSS